MKSKCHVLGRLYLHRITFTPFCTVLANAVCRALRQPDCKGAVDSMKSKCHVLRQLYLHRITYTTSCAEHLLMLSSVWRCLQCNFFFGQLSKCTKANLVSPGIDPGTFGLWAQHASHCASPFSVNFVEVESELHQDRISIACAPRDDNARQEKERD